MMFGSVGIVIAIWSADVRTMSAGAKCLRVVSEAGSLAPVRTVEMLTAGCTVPTKRVL